MHNRNIHLNTNLNLTQSDFHKFTYLLAMVLFSFQMDRFGDKFINCKGAQISSSILLNCNKMGALKQGRYPRCDESHLAEKIQEQE